MTKHPSARKQRKQKRAAAQPNPFATERPFDRLRVRRAPKYVPFLIVGGLAGILAAILVAVIPEDQEYSASTVFGFILVLLVVVGVGLGGLTALVFDWLGRRKQRQVQVAKLADADTAQSRDGRSPDQ